MKDESKGLETRAGTTSVGTKPHCIVSILALALFPITCVIMCVKPAPTYETKDIELEILRAVTPKEVIDKLKSEVNANLEHIRIV